MNLMAALGSHEVQTLWARISEEFPHLAAIVNGCQMEGIVEPKDMFEEMMDWYDHGVPRGVSPGWPSLGQIYTVMPGESTVITGTPSSGKSRFATAMLVNIAKTEGWHSLFISPEMMPVKRHMELALTQYIGKPFRPGTKGRMSRNEAQEGMQWLQKHFTWLWPKHQPLTIAYILQMAKHQAITRGTKAVVLDPWNRLSHRNRRKEAMETEYIGECLADLFGQAQTYDYHQVIIAHPTKVFAEGGKFPVVTPNLIAGSANWWNMPENVLSIRRDIGNDEDHTTEVYTCKVRWDENGRMGRHVDLYYHPETARYSEMVSQTMPYASNGYGRNGKERYG
jgi:twinkle protein